MLKVTRHPPVFITPRLQAHPPGCESGRGVLRAAQGMGVCCIFFDVTGAAVSHAAVGDYGAYAFTSSSLSSLLCSWSHPYSSDKRQAGINTRGANID